MVDEVFNIAKGRVKELQRRVDADDPVNSALIVVLLKLSEAEATLRDYDDLNALLGAAGNTEADFTNYARKVLTEADVTHDAPDDTNDWNQCTIANQTWSAAGGALNNTMTHALICYDDDTTGGNDTNIIPLTMHTFTPTTNGNDLVLQIDPDGYYRAS
jgi:hypothetical protein